MDPAPPKPASEEPTKPRRAVGPISAKYLDEIILTRKVISVARLSENVAHLQLAAYQAWPHTNAQNAANHKAFFIPGDRPAVE